MVSDLGRRMVGRSGDESGQITIKKSYSANSSMCLLLSPLLVCAQKDALSRSNAEKLFLKGARQAGQGKADRGSGFHSSQVSL